MTIKMTRARESRGDRSRSPRKRPLGRE